MLPFARVRSPPHANGDANDVRLYRKWLAYLPLADASASLRRLAQSSQHTSTVRPPTLTLIDWPSRSQSHAAHVFFFVMARSLA